MDKKQLQTILSSAYNPPLWRQVLTDVFGARNLNQTPQKILLPSNELAENAFELGFFNTSDDRIIGLYQIDLKSNVKIERNKVGLRELLRNIYKYDVDGALVVFVQNDKWRLSFISEIRVLKDDGSIDKKATEPKRYTYLLGKGEKTKTPTDRLARLANQKISLEDIRAAFSVEALNNDFYKQVSEYFYELVGSTTTKGKKTEVRQRIMSLPSASENTKENIKLYQKFGVRLIGRTIFCWFLKVKKSERDKPLLPESLLSLEAAEKYPNYYHSILEPLFFQTLNTPMDKRIDDLPEGCEIVPFLNGGLFEDQPEDFYDFNRHSGISNHLNTLKIPDDWFKKLFKTLEEYNFTIDENSPVDVEISVDPEMLGRIFENLLAAIDEDSGEVARKATGSFYTPREIVNYMVDESLLIYLKSKLLEENIGFQSLKSPQATFGGNDWRAGQPHLEYPLNENRWKDKPEELEKILRELFSYSETENPFDESDTKRLIKAIDECKILDPACGSGAFPIGVLQRLVYLLGRLDRKSRNWKQAQLDKIDSLIENAKEIDDPKIRGKVTGDLENRKGEIERDFATKELDFGRKLFLIENCIYGVDIQPIAAEISKLRCFLTLIVDDTIDETAENRGVNPLPNLEFKFVTADALLKLPPSGLFNSDAQLNELAAVRHEYINSFGASKDAAKQHFKRIQDEIYDAQVKNFQENYDRRAFELSRWNPFGHEKVDWFDSEWMFGVKAFDIVIGNPPYGASVNDKELLRKLYPNSTFGVTETYKYFIDRYISSLNQSGILSYITSDSFLEKENFLDIRNLLLKKSEKIFCIKLGDNIFENVKLPTAILCTKVNENSNSVLRTFDVTEEPKPQRKIENALQKGFQVIDFTSDKLKRFIVKDKHIDYKNCKPLIDLYDQVMGVKVYQVGKGKPKQSKYEIENDIFIADKAKSKEWLKFIDSGVKKYKLEDKNKFIKYGAWLAEPRDPKYFYNPKIILREVVNPIPFATFYKDVAIVKNTNAVIIKRHSKFGLFYLLAILNSAVFNYYIQSESPKSKNKLFPSITSNLLKNFPVYLADNTTQHIFENLVDYILFLKETDEAEQVNEYVPNSHLVEQFEEVIDALVYELYFEEDFRRAEIEFLKYAARDFPPLENLSREEKIETIHAAYQTLRRKDGEIRNNLKLMDIRLADLIMPIKTAR